MSTAFSCKTCFYASRFTQNSEGHMIATCRRYPPQNVWLDDEVHPTRPLIYDDDSCGEYNDGKITIDRSSGIDVKDLI